MKELTNEEHEWKNPMKKISRFLVLTVRKNSKGSILNSVKCHKTEKQAKLDIYTFLFYDVKYDAKNLYYELIKLTLTPNKSNGKI